MKKVTGLSFRGYKERNELFPEKDQSTFYDVNKEYIMKGLKPGGALPWNRMTTRAVVNSSQHVTPEETYDHMKAIETKTHKMKPRSIALTNFGKTSARNDMLYRTTDGFQNVILENTRSDREVEIQARKEQHKRYLDLSTM